MSVFRPLLKELRWVKSYFTLGMICLLLGTGISQLAPLHLQTIIDGSLTGLSKGQSLDTAALIEQLSFYLVILIGASGLIYVSKRFLAYCANKIASLQRQRAYEVMQNLPIAYFDDKPAGKIATRIVNDTETLSGQFYNTLLSHIVVIVVEVGVIYSILFRLNWRLGLALLGLLPIFYVWQIYYQKLTNHRVKDFYDARSELNTLVNETMHGSEILQLFDQEEAILTDFQTVAGKMKRADSELIQISSIVSWTLADLIKHLVITGVLTYVGYQYLGDSLGVSPGRVFVYLTYVKTLFELLGSLVRQLPNLQRSKETGRRVMALLNEALEEDKTAILEVPHGQVTFEEVGFAYVADKPVLEDISFTVKRGESLALVGHTGSGKSSIMNLLYRFYEPKQGRIVIDGKDISQYSRESLRAYMGIVLQDPYLFTGTIASNVRMGREDKTDEEVREALEKVGAGPMLDRLEKGIDEPVVEKGSAFSSGERQLIAFARTLLADPKILILDEATSHIDTETEELIQEAMAVVKKGRTTFIIAHRLSTIQNSDQIIVLDGGRIVERGRHASLMALNGRYAQMHRIQQKVGI